MQNKPSYEALSQSEEQFRLLIEKSLTAVWIHEDYVIKYANKQYADMLGYQVEDIIESSFWNYVHPDDVEHFKRRARERAAGQTPRDHYEVRMLKKTGQTLMVEVFSGEMTYQGRPARMGNMVDISERKRTEEELRETRELLTTALEQSPSGIVIADAPDVRIRLANAAAFGIRGGDTRILTNIDVAEHARNWQLLRPDGTVYPGEELPLSRAVLRGETTSSEEMIIRDAEGSEHWVITNAAPIRSDRGEVIAGIVIFHDITMRKQAEKELRESEERYRRIFENLIDISYRTDARGNIEFMSPSLQTILGYTPEEVAGKAISDFYRDETLREKFLSRLLRDGQVNNFQAEIRRKDGDYSWVSTNAKVLSDEDGNFLGVEGITRDISELKRAEEHNRQLEQNLRQSQKMEAVGTLAGGIAHDFNNILSAVLGYTELTREKLPKGSEERDNLDVVLSAANRAKELIKQILMFSRKGREERNPVEISYVVDEAIKLLRKTIPSTVRISTDVTRKTGTIKADATRIHQVVINLCTNALHSLNNEEGDIGISLERVKVDHVTAAQYPNLHEGQYALLSVEDSGEGIDPVAMARIFEPFFTTKDQGKGTGMGLAVVHGIVQSHGGAIGVESTLGSGTTFRVYFPIAERGNQENPSVDGGPCRGTEHLLLVDDEPMLVNLGTKLLESLGYTVTASTSAREVLELFRADPTKYDLVITDQTMPEMSGDVLTREMMGIRPGVPVIICTGHSAMLDAEKAQAIGVRAFLMKPFRRDKLSETLRKVLDG